MPTSTTRPPGRWPASATSTSRSVPPTSNATSAWRSAGSLPASDGSPRAPARPRRGGARAGRPRARPGAPARATATISSPIGPQPTTTTFAPRLADVPEVERVDGDAQRLEHRAGHAVEGVGERSQRGGRPRRYSRSPPSQSPCRRRRRGHRLRGGPRGSARRRRTVRGSTATRRPSSGPPSTTPANSCPGTTGRVSRVPPMPPSSNQRRSDPRGRSPPR